MKKYSIAYLSSILSIVLFLSACSEDFFDTPTGKRFTPDDHYDYIIDGENSYLGCFVYLQDIAANQVLVDGLRSDLLEITENADKEMIEIYNHDLTADNAYLDPSLYYKIIINVNEVLPNLPQIMEKDRDFDSTMYNSFNGALVTLRSWSYFMLAKLNGEVGLLDEDLNKIDPANPPVYLTKNQIIDELIADVRRYDDEEDRFRFPVDHYALLGEMYLEKRNYDSAIFYLKKCIDGLGVRRQDYFVSNTFGKQNWHTMFISSYNLFESIISAVPYSAQEGQENPLQLWMEFDYMVKPTSVLVNLYANQVQLSGDPGDIYRGEGITITTTEDEKVYATKYSIDEGFPLSADVILYRPADIHLLLAEALNRAGQRDNALVLVNTGFSQVSPRPVDFNRWNKNSGVRGRVGLNKVSGDNVNQVEDLIIQERAMELAFEGKRFFDLVRIAERRNDPAYLANKVANKFSGAKKEEIKKKLMDPKNWYLPLNKIE